MRVWRRVVVGSMTVAALVVTGTSGAVAAPPMPPATADAASAPEVVAASPAAAPAPSAPVVEARGALADPTPLTLVQPDGTTFTARQWGDGAHHGHELLTGHTIERDAAGTWRYVAAIVDGEAVLSTRRADQPAPRALATGQRPADPGPMPTPGDGPSGAPHVPHTGTAPTLVILTQFADQANVGSTASQWASSFFGATGSVKKYYADASYGDLDVVPVTETSGTANDGVVGWVTLARNHPRSGYAAFPASAQANNAVVRDAVIAANPFVNFAAYDTSGNGAIEPAELHVVIIAAGYEAASGCGGATVWGHWYRSYYATPPVVDGTTVAGTASGGYTMFGETQCGGGDHRATIGIMVHELGHDLGWPDLYATNGVGNGGVGSWSVMSYGSWNTVPGQHAGSVPPLPDPFLRSLQGWVVPTQVVGTGQSITVPSAATSSTVFRLRSNPNGIDWAADAWGDQSGAGQYFLVENRQQTGWDAGTPGCGILIWHITENAPTFAPNDSTPRLVQLEQADGLGHIDGSANVGDGGDPWPGTSVRTTFNASSTPSSRLNSGADSGVSVTIPSGACTASKTITVTAPANSGPANDAFASPTTITGASGSTTGSNEDGSRQPGEPNHAGAPGGASVWWTWTAPSSGTLRLSTAGSAFDTMLGLYRGGTLTGLTEVASNDDAASGGLQSTIPAAPVVAGTTYRIAVDGYSGASGSISLAWSLTVRGPSPFASWGAYVDRQYADFMGAPAPSGTRSQWITTLTADPTKRGDVVASLRDSSRHTGIVDPVVRLYRAYFLRNPDLGGLNYWISQRAGGRSATQVSNSFAASQEFRTRYGTLTNHQFVQQIYRNILGREGEAAGVDYWTAQLDGGRRTRGQVMIGFSESPEYRTRMTVEVDVAVVTLMMLGRAPTADELTYWRAEQAAGRLSDRALAEWVLPTAAYAARL